MRRKLLSVTLLSLILFSVFSQGGTEAVDVSSTRRSDTITTTKSEPAAEPQVELIDIKANLVYPYDVNDTLSVLCLVGDFAAHHNGAIITADSAVRYGDDRLECFGKVLINQNTTYAYADRADYDGARNLAALYSPIIKVVDEDVTLYTYNFTFNTLYNVGRYWGGGVTTKRGATESEGDVVMESQSGYYYADQKRVVGVREVDLRGEGYEMDGDSVIYEMEAERAHFFLNTNIWNEKGEYIFGDEGMYDKEGELYRVTKSAYLLTDEQEIWSDSMEYRRAKQEALLWENVQIDDTTNKSLGFGDWGHYWGEIERVLLTRDPAVINYDPKEPDSLFLRADTIQMLSYAVGTGPIVDSAEIKRIKEIKDRMAAATQSVVDGGGEVDDEVLEEIAELDAMIAPDSVMMAAVADSDLADNEAEEQTEEQTDEQTEATDEEEISLADAGIEVDSAALVVLSDTTLLATEVTTEVAKKRFSIVNFFKGDSTAKAERRAKYAERSAERTAQIEQRRLADLNAYKAREYRKLSERRDKLEQRIEKRSAKGRNIYSDSMVLLRVVSELEAIYDTLPKQSVLDSLAVIDSLRGVIAAIKSDSIPERDSLYRVLKAYRDVRSYRSDFQMVCDSMVGISYDSTLRLYIKPIIWTQTNQITAEEVDIYTIDGDLDYADFLGSPIMSSEVISGDSIYYNQIKGKTMRATFENNEVRRNDVDGNVQTIYYMQDDDTGLVNTIAKIESGTATFFIVDQELDGITYRATPTYVFAPLDKVPMDLPYTLEGFEWHADKRPARDSVFNRTIRPSVREQRSAMPRPTFPIKQQIEERREELERTKSWFDRIENVSPDATEWMKELGYTPGEPRKDSPF